MMKKLIAATIVLAMLAATVPMSLADTGNNKHYNGWIGADSPLYGLKTGFQKLDVYLTFNNTEKFKKQMALADERFNETLDAIDSNNLGALNASTDEYEEILADANETSYDLEDQSIYADLAPMLYHHQEVFYGVMNDPNVTIDVQNRTMYAYELTIRMKNGMPFYYDNGTAYFIPPGQMKKIENGITNGSKVPAGLLKKGYKNPKPTIDIENGSTSWPWDAYPYPTTSAKNNGKGNGNGNNKK
jgi:hypothetical protein